MNQIVSVQPGSLAARSGLRAGDRLLAINGQPVLDMIDYQYGVAEDRLKLTLERFNPALNSYQRLEVRLRNSAGEPVGLEFAEPTFDGIRVCANNCPFCFVYRTPKGFRPGLYIKDDDYRYSFLYGGFVTLTNLKDEDFERIIRQRLTPLYVSVHCTDLELRRRLLGNSSAPDIIEQLKRLVAGGIEVHTQVVLVPEVNDGAKLAQTVAELAALYPAVQTIGLVPVGLAGGEGYNGDRRLNKAGRGRGFEDAPPLPMRTFREDEAGRLIEIAHDWQKRFRKEKGTSLVYLSDEFYLLCGQEVPGKAHYQEFDQLENGVGLVRLFLEDWKKTEKKLPPVLKRPIRATIITARLITPTFMPIVERMNQVEGLNLNLLTVDNFAFGATVTVSGLLTGGDVRDALLKFEKAGQDPGEIIFLPQVMLDKKGFGGRFLDDLTPADIEQITGRKVVMAGFMSEVWAVLRS